MTLNRFLKDKIDVNEYHYQLDVANIWTIGVMSRNPVYLKRAKMGVYSIVEKTYNIIEISYCKGHTDRRIAIDQKE